MIDDEKTFAEKGYRSTELSKYSIKKVYALCEGEDCRRSGGRGRWVIYSQYRELCYSCAIKKRDMVKKDDRVEKLPWIDDDITFREKGYRSTDLKHVSIRHVWAICANPDCKREGGRGRWVKFCRCFELCHACAHKTDEYRKSMSASQQGITIDEWEEFVSFGKYCGKFNEDFKEEVRDRFDRKCFMCPTTEEKNGRKLDVHHVNYDKECICSGNDCEFVPLCRKCHAKTNHNRELWERLIINVLYYEGYIE